MLRNIWSRRSSCSRSRHDHEGQRRLKQVETAELFGIRQPDALSKMLRGEFRQFSVERLLRFLVAKKLDQDVEIVIKPRPWSQPRAGAPCVLTQSSAAGLGQFLGTGRTELAAFGHGESMQSCGVVIRLPSSLDHVAWTSYDRRPEPPTT